MLIVYSVMYTFKGLIYGGSIGAGVAVLRVFWALLDFDGSLHFYDAFILFIISCIIGAVVGLFVGIAKAVKEKAEEKREIEEQNTRELLKNFDKNS